MMSPVTPVRAAMAARAMAPTVTHVTDWTDVMVESHEGRRAKHHLREKLPANRAVISPHRHPARGSGNHLVLVETGRDATHWTRHLFTTSRLT